MYEQLENDFNGNKDAVIEMLIKNVMEVNIEIPRVVRGNFEEEEDKWGEKILLYIYLKVLLNQQSKF